MCGQIGKRAGYFVAGPVIAGLLLTACSASTPDDGVRSDSTRPSEPAQSQESWSEIEMAVLDALDDLPYPMGAAYEVEQDRVLVTVFVEDGEMDESQIDDLETLGRQAAGGIDVVVECSDEGPPEEQDGGSQ